MLCKDCPYWSKPCDDHKKGICCKDSRSTGKDEGCEVDLTD